MRRRAAVLGALAACFAFPGTPAPAAGINWYHALFPLSFTPAGIVTVHVEANSSPSTAVLELQQLEPEGWITQSDLGPVLPGLEALSFPAPANEAPLTLRVVAVASGLVFWVSKPQTVTVARPLAAAPACPAGETGSAPDCGASPPSPTAASALKAGETLAPGSELESADGHYVLAMDANGDLVEQLGSGRVLWSSGTAGNPGAFATLQASAGDFVVDAANGQTIWNSGIASSPGDYLVVQPNGDLVAYSALGEPAWDAGVSNFVLQPGETLAASQYLQVAGEDLVMQTDGDLELLGANGLLWSSGTSGNPGAVAVLQPGDGDLVIDSSTGQQLWAAGLTADGGDHLTLEGGGAMAVENAAGAPLWSSGTSGLGGPVGCIATPSDFATALLTELGAPLTTANVSGMIGWEAAEGGNWINAARFNPLNNERDWIGSRGIWPGMSPQAYADWSDGIAATIETLYNGHLNAILRTLAEGTSAYRLAHVVGHSTWGTADFSDLLPPHYDPPPPRWQPAC
jgi:hypothetical protein